MLGLCLKVSEKDMWDNTSALQVILQPTMTEAETEKFTNVTDVLLGFYGGAIQKKALCRNRQQRDSYINNYVKSVKARNYIAKRGYETEIVDSVDETQPRKNYIIADTASALQYVETAFNDIETVEACETMVQDFRRLRNKVLAEQHIDMYVLLYLITAQTQEAFMHTANDSVAEETEDEIAVAAQMLRSICNTYRRQEFMAELLQCNGVVRKILQSR